MQTISYNYFFHLCFPFLLIFLTCTASSSSSSSSLIISRFQKYLQINTAHPNPNYYEATDFIISQAKSLALESRIIEFVKNKPLILLKWPGKNPKLPSVLLNSHIDVVPVEPHKWTHPPFGAHIDSDGNIYARGSQDMKSVGMQYLEAIRKLRDAGFEPTRTIYLSYVPDEEIGGRDGAEKLAESDLFKEMNVAFVLDEGGPSSDENYRAYYAERSPMWLVIKAKGAPGHGAKLYDSTAMENLLESIESIRRFRASEFDMVKAGLKTEGELISINLVFLKAGTQSSSGFVMNMQPSEAEAGIDIRVPPTADQEALERRIAEEWAPVSRNMTFEFKDKFPILDKFGKPAVTVADSSNPWWVLLEEAVHNAGGKFGKPDIFQGATDASFFRQQGLPAIGFSPIANTPGLAHNHNEFINQHEYLKGIDIYASIIKACASYAEQTDMKSVGMQYLEAIRKLRDSGFEPTRTIYLSYVPDEEIGGRDGAGKLAESDLFKEMNVAFVLDEGRPSSDEMYRAYYAERSPTWLVIKATGAPGHGASLYDNSAMENLLESIESIRRFRASQFDMLKAGLKSEGELIAINLVFLKAGTQSSNGFVMNIQPSEAEAGTDIRVPPTADQEALERRIAEEWAPVSRNMTFEFKEKYNIMDKFGKPAITVADSSNPWWVLLEEAVHNAGGRFGKPDIFRGGTDARYFRQQGLPAIGFSLVANTPGLAHSHDEFINQHEYLKGIDIYASIIKACTSYAEQTVAEASKHEL